MKREAGKSLVLKNFPYGFFDAIRKQYKMGHPVISNILGTTHDTDFLSNFTNNRHKNPNETESPRSHMEGTPKGTNKMQINSVGGVNL